MDRIVVNRVLSKELEKNKYTSISSNEFSFTPSLVAGLKKFSEDWNHLEPDNYLKGSAKFRFRRLNYIYFLPSNGQILPYPRRAYTQSGEINSYAGDVVRNFPPIQAETLVNEFLHELIKFNFQHFPISKKKADVPWMIDVHQIRIIGTPDEMGEPTPEGPHHDENDFGAIHLIDRQNSSGGVNTIYNNDGEPIKSLTLENPMDSMIICDPDVMHGVSPIFPVDPSKKAIRDVLLMGYSYSPGLEMPDWSEYVSNDTYQTLLEEGVL